MTTNQIKQNESWKNIAVGAILLIIIISWATPLTTWGQGMTTLFIGAILIGLNLVRRQNGIEMGKSSFMIGAFLMAAGFTEASPFYFQIGGEATIIPTILPLAGLMILANALFNKLQA